MLDTVWRSSVRGRGLACPMSQRSACVRKETILMSVIFTLGALLVQLSTSASAPSPDALSFFREHRQEPVSELEFGRTPRRDVPLPLGGGGLSALAPEGSKRLRRLGRKGEGVTAAVCATIERVLPARAT